MKPNPAASGGKEGVIFVVAKAKGAGNEITYKIFALDLADGKPLSAGKPISGSVSGPSGTTITFTPLFHLNRPALLLDQDVLYIAFGGHCDIGNYRGWLFAYNVSNPANPTLLDRFTTTFRVRPNPQSKEGRAGIWMSGGGLAAVDGAFYFATGDGTYDVSNPAFRNFGNAVLKGELVDGKIKIQDWFVRS